MKCPECGEKMTSARRDYDATKVFGLPLVLVNIEVRTCPNHGDGPVIPRLEGLLRALVSVIIGKRTRLTGAEIRFLRKHLGWSGQDFARHMGVDPATVSRWENDREPIGPQADRAIRLMAAIGQPVADYGARMLEAMAAIEGEPRPVTLRAATERGAWTAQAA